MKKSKLCTALGLILGVSSAAPYAATLKAGNTLTITLEMPSLPARG